MKKQKPLLVIPDIGEYLKNKMFPLPNSEKRSARPVKATNNTYVKGRKIFQEKKEKLIG